MMKVMKILLCGLVLAVPVFANESDNRQTATSLKYVTTKLNTRQDKLSAAPNNAIEYTDSAGDITQRTVESDLNGADTSLPTVSAVTDGLSHKQDTINPINDHTAVTYTGTAGGISTKGIYQATGTYAEQTGALIDAKTFNAALKTGLDNEFVCDEDNRSPDGHCWLWQIHNTAPCANLLSPAPAGTMTQDGITVVSDGNGLYTISGTATASSVISWGVQEFVFPVSVAHDGTGSIYCGNSMIGTNNDRFVFLYNATTQDTWGLSSINRFIPSYSTLVGRTVNKIGFAYSNAQTYNFTLQPAVYNDG